ncbi:hypothetical protein [Paraburkholderia sp. ZP32-5]|uniref:hypothetical protein n=1 Tax=Paraburkholderia sp. ZP32-5 TaxID=2883245 RepID=UPI001F1F35BF|nr:hypothetical protein [Paraburkholderia sp. ZP32-5]
MQDISVERYRQGYAPRCAYVQKEILPPFASFYGIKAITNHGEHGREACKAAPDTPKTTLYKRAEAHKTAFNPTIN